MAPFYSLLSDLHLARSNYVVKVRCVRCYFVRGANRNEFSSVELVIHDIQGTKIHCTIPRNLVKQFGLKIQESKLYAIHHFYVRPNQMRFKTTEHAYRIMFTPKSQLCEVQDPEFPSFMYSFKNFEQIAEIQNVHDVPLFDVIGVIVGKGYVRDQNNSRLIELVIEDEGHNRQYITLWEDYVDQFMKQIDKKDKKMPIVIVQFCRATVFKGELRLSTSYHASKISLNRDIPEIQAFRERISGDETFNATVDLNLAAFAKESDELTDGSFTVKSLQELFFFEEGMYWICAKIEGVFCNKGWYYTACKKCSKKVSKIRTRFFCDRCNKYDSKATKRFMLSVNVVDHSCNATLQLWDKEVVQLLGKNASQISVEGEEIDVMPKEIEDILIGRVVLFKVQLKDEGQFQDNPYTVMKICTESEVVQKFSSNCEVSPETPSLDEISEQDFIDQCNSLQPITELPVLTQVQMIHDSDFITPKASEKEYDMEMPWLGEDSVKRKLEDDFDETQDEKRKKVVVKIERLDED